MAAMKICWMRLLELSLTITALLYGNIKICSCKEKSDCIQTINIDLCLKYCDLPDCYCNSVSIPCSMNEMTLKTIPQLVMITYSGGLTKKVYDGFMELLEDRVNPNGYPMKATFFVNHKNTDYWAVQDLYSRSHEIGSYGITDEYKKWKEEMIGQCEILQNFANVSMVDCKGLRVPDAKIGGDTQFKMMKNNFRYDNSIKISFDLNSPPPWPYPLIFPGIISDKCSPPGLCPSGTYNNLWAVPILTDRQCTVMSECFQGKTDSETFKLLNTRFLHHYKSNKAPFPLWVDARFFADEFQKPLKGLVRLLKKLERIDDVYVVNVLDVINWMSDPADKETVKSEHYPWFKLAERTGSCYSPKLCPNINGFKTCMECPKVNPSLDNPSGKDTKN